jgi:hypothetical protein
VLTRHPIAAEKRLMSRADEFAKLRNSGGMPDFAELLEQERRQQANDRSQIRAGIAGGSAWEAASYAVSCGLSDEPVRALYDLWRAGAMSIDQLREAIPSVWLTNSSPAPIIGERAWLAMFKAAWFLCQVVERSLHYRDGSVEEIPTIYPTELIETPPDSPPTIWRGASLTSNGRGFSWTQYRECAEGFAQTWANLYGRASGLYRANVPSRAVLAVFGDDREQEFIVNPNMLRGRVQLVVPIEPEPMEHHPVFGTR